MERFLATKHISQIHTLKMINKNITLSRKSVK